MWLTAHTAHTQNKYNLLNGLMICGRMMGVRACKLLSDWDNYAIYILDVLHVELGCELLCTHIEAASFRIKRFGSTTATHTHTHISHPSVEWNDGVFRRCSQSYGFFLIFSFIIIFTLIFVIFFFSLRKTAELLRRWSMHATIHSKYTRWIGFCSWYLAGLFFVFNISLSPADDGSFVTENWYWPWK